MKLLTKLDLLTITSSVAQWLEHPAKSGRVLGSDPSFQLMLFLSFNFPYITNLKLCE